MRCVAFQDAEGAHLAFMLCSPDLGQSTGDCVFVVVPERTKLFDTPAAESLFRRREAAESTWQVVHRQSLSLIVRSPGLAEELFVEFPGDAAGKWGRSSGVGRQVLGRAVLPQ